MVTSGNCEQSFRVIDSLTGNPILGATISLTRGKGPCTTNASGRCSVTLESGKSYGWSIIKQGYETGYPPLFIACTTFEKSIQLVSLAPPSTPKTAFVTFDSNPKGAKVTVDGTVIGNT